MAPVEVSMLAADTTGFSVEFLKLKEFALGGTVVAIDDALRRVVSGAVDVVVDVVVDGGTAGILVDCRVTRRVGAAFNPEVGVVDVVRVNTSTKSKSGLDHIRMRVPFIELSVDAIRVEG